MDRSDFERFEDLATSTSVVYGDSIEEVNSDGSYMMETGGGLEEEDFDLFEDFDNLPQDVQDLFFEYEESDDTYDRNQEMLNRLEPLGYTFDYGLDATPFGLKKLKKGGTLTANDISKGTWLKNDSTKVLAKVWNVDPRLGMMQLEDVYGNRDTKFRYLAGWSLVKAPEKKLKEIKEEWAEMAKGGGVKMKNEKSYYQELPSYSGYKWTGFDKGKHIFQKKEQKGYSVIEALESDLTNGNIEFMAKHGLSNMNKKAKGGGVGDENKEMVLNNAQQIEHHAEELENAAKKSKHVPAWVVAKVYNASSNISDATHYLEGVNTIPKEQFERIHEEIENHKMADGGGLNSFMDKQMHISKVCKTHGCSSKDYLNAKKKYGIGGTLLLTGLGVAGLIAYNNSKNPITEDEYKLKMYKKGTLQNTIIVDESYVNKATEDYKKLGYIVRVAKIKKMATGGGVEEKEGLYVTGRTREDNTKIGEMIEAEGLYAEWNPREGYWFFEEQKDMYDALEKQLENYFAEYGINARFEGIFAKGGPTKAQSKKVGKVMHEFKEGTLHSGKSDKVVKNPKQAIAIALSEAGLSKNKGWKYKK
jgi:hypothetical protein